jgi:hypothetical protein
MRGYGITCEYLARKTMEKVRELQLDLSGLHVLTEAATGPYSLTAVIAAHAGAEVVAKARDSRYGSVGQIRQETEELASALGVQEMITIVEEVSDAQIAAADIVTNSGHLRPLDAAFIDKMRVGAAIPLMYEAWELRSTDVDIDACRRHGVQVAGTNERHSAVGVFEYLGLVVLRAALQAGFAVMGDRCLVVSDNEFGEYVARTLRANGALVEAVAACDLAATRSWDVVVVAATPPASGGRQVQLEGIDASLYCQVWGDVNRARTTGRWQPEEEPCPGHMGLTLDSLGPMPILRLQAGGLKCGEVMLAGGQEGYSDIVQWLHGFPC